MEKFKNLNNFINPLIIIFIILILAIFLGNNFYVILSDRGRELLIPQEIMNGLAPYKDINLIYFPLGYYINALLYKIFGISIYTLICSQTFFSIVYMLGFYFLSKEFLNKTTSLLLTLLVIVSCIFANNDLFGFIFPYSFAASYGILGTFFAVFCFVKLFKTDNLKYLYLSALSVSFAICCKLEFFVAPIIFIIGLFLYKKLPVKEYIKTALIMLIFPVITFTILIWQGVSIENIISSIKFGTDFAKTPVMSEFLSFIGVYPFEIIKSLKIFIKCIPCIFFTLILSIIAFLLENKFPKKFILPIFAIIILFYNFQDNSVYSCWLILPYITLIALFLKYKDLIKNKPALFIIISAILMGQREFFKLILYLYGTFSFPLYILSLCILIKLFAPKFIFNIEIKKFINFILIILICIFSTKLISKIYTNNFILKTPKGNIYTSDSYSRILNDTIDYINKNTDKNDTILALPEGTLINFLTDRKVDMHCFMMDRLYHDAYGEENARNIIAKTNSDYILLIEDFDLNNFSKPYLYHPKSSLSGKYIAENYDIVKKFITNDASIIILKNKIKHNF